MNDFRLYDRYDSNGSRFQIKGREIILKTWQSSDTGIFFCNLPKERQQHDRTKLYLRETTVLQNMEWQSVVSFEVITTLHARNSSNQRLKSVASLANNQPFEWHNGIQFAIQELCSTE